MTSAHVATQREAGGPSICWCCGAIEDPSRLVRLGNHPEVAVCVRCAHALSKWAWEIEDRSRTGIAVRARDQFRLLRKAVMRRGWQHHRLIGRQLRCNGKRLP
jgi:hypothetical protein